MYCCPERGWDTQGDEFWGKGSCSITGAGRKLTVELMVACWFGGSRL